MGKIEKGSFVELVVLIVSISIAGIIIWPILDILFDAVFTHSGFVYSVQDHVVEPIVFGCIVGLVFWTIDVIAVKKKKK